MMHTTLSMQHRTGARHQSHTARHARCLPKLESVLDEDLVVRVSPVHPPDSVDDVARIALYGYTYTRLVISCAWSAQTPRCPATSSLPCRYSRPGSSHHTQHSTQHCAHVHSGILLRHTCTDPTWQAHVSARRSHHIFVSAPSAQTAHTHSLTVGTTLLLCRTPHNYHTTTDTSTQTFGTKS